MPMNLRRIDCHVHIVGDGSGGSGCWFALKGPWSSYLGGAMLKEVGLPKTTFRDGGLDRLYAGRLAELVRTSLLDAAMILAQEAPRNERGEELEGVGAFYVPNSYVLELCRKHPEFLPAVSIHPARPDAMDELEKCLEAGARVMKCLPNCINLDCGDKRFIPFWERMAEAGMILLAHTGGEMTLPVLRPEFADPRVLELPLQCGVTAIAAHCAGRSCLRDPDYTDDLIRMFDEHPNLYGDNSALCSPIRSRTLKKILRPGVVERIVHGSDFPVPVSGLGPWLRGRVSWKTCRTAGRNPNPLERDCFLKRAMGFPEETFTRLDALMRRLPG